ncbi:MAG TPA: metallophosphoesterase family protein [Candidatus Omnitrophota bacterium]|nr:metallophosphoesterase family protein [Candidatus Omnitrophota bacterium]
MRYGIFSDIHGNLEALSAVLKACREEGVRHYFCAGDIVGYGANPRECIEEMKRIKAKVVAGNHDWAVAGKEDTRDFNPMAQEAVSWTKKNLSDNEIKFLGALPLVHHHSDFIMVHGSLNAPERFIYVTDINLAMDTFYLMDKNLCFIGHTHVPGIMVHRGGKTNYANSLKIEVDPRNKYLINVGSVGQPRDGNPQATYCIYDPDLKTVEIKRVAYDITSAQNRIMEAGLPELLAHRLSIGQ